LIERSSNASNAKKPVINTGFFVFACDADDFAKRLLNSSTDPAVSQSGV